VSERIWLLRHGDTEWTEEGLHTGLAEPPLSAAGREEARRAGRLLAGRPFERVLVSPQARARETCELAGYGSQAEIEPLLVEWDYGEFEGITDEEAQRRQPGWDLFADGAPGGESPAEIAERADRVLAVLERTPGRCLVVGHGKFLRALAARWIDQPVTLGAALPFDPAALAVLEREGRQPLLRCWNYRDELPDEKPTRLLRRRERWFNRGCRSAADRGRCDR
jgi:probable phosphoglycerate mutase